MTEPTTRGTPISCGRRFSGRLATCVIPTLFHPERPPRCDPRVPTGLSKRHAGRMPRTDSATRVIRSSPEQVFSALVDEEVLLQWLPPGGMSGRFERFDPRPGGSYRLVLTYVDGSSGSGKSTPTSDVVEARFIDVVPELRVVQAVDFVSDDPAFTGTMTMTWELSAEDDGTRVGIRAEGVPAGISAADHVAGMQSSLANLAAYLEAGQ